MSEKEKRTKKLRAIQELLAISAAQGANIVDLIAKGSLLAADEEYLKEELEFWNVDLESKLDKVVALNRKWYTIK